MKQVSGGAYNAGDFVSTEAICEASLGQKDGAGPASPPADGAVIIAGDRFGYGDRVAEAVEQLHKQGVRCIVARSFGRRFYREAINSGLALFTADLAGRAADGDEVAFDLRKGTIAIGGEQIQAERYPERLARVVEYGSLVTAVKKELGKD